MSNVVAAPQAFVDIYPADNAPLQLRGATVISLSVEKALYEEAGRFAIELPPGGPNGPNGVSWAEAIPPMSLCIIGLKRWQYAEIVMVGVVTRVRYAEQYRTGAPTQRRIIIEGEDLAYFFNQESYSSLVVAANIGAGAAAARFGNGGFALPALLGGQLIGTNATPASWSQAYWQQVIGPNGVLANTTLPYGRSTITVSDAIAASFEEYPGFTIPMAAPFIGDMGTFGAQLRAALQFPVYELIAMCAPFGAFNVPSASTVQPFQIAEIQSRSNFYLIGRLNPAPNLLVSAAAGGAFTYDGMDVSRWNKLPTFRPDGGAISTMLEFSLDGLANFYWLDPTFMSGAQYGGSLGNLSPFMLEFGGAVDLASIDRYGLREVGLTSNWFASVSNPPQAISQDFNQLVANLTCWLASYHEPMPLMASGKVQYPLRPDIIPGCVFELAAFQKYATSATSEGWSFYIEGVRHDFVFGGASTTTLTLTRGLPNSVYEDAAPDGMLQALCTGNAKRIAGAYVNAGGPPNLQPFNIANGAATMGGLNRFFQSAQVK